MPEDTTVDNSEGAATSNNDANEIAASAAPGESSTLGVDNANNNGDTKQNDGPKTTAEAIADAMEPGSNESDEAPPPSAEDQEKIEAEKTAASNARLDKNPRFQEVIAQRDQYQDELKKYAPIQEALKDSYLDNDNAIATLKLGDSINRALVGDGDPIDALNQIVPIVQALQSAAGLLLPADLQQAVSDGQISKKYAEDLAKQRATSALLGHKMEREQKVREQKEVEAANVHIGQIRNDVNKAVVDWETQQQQTDPDYEPKRQLIYDAITATLIARKNQGLITTPQEAVEISKTAYDKVSKVLSAAYPKRNSIQKPINNGAPSSKVDKQPANRREAIRLAVEGTGRR